MDKLKRKKKRPSKFGRAAGELTLNVARGLYRIRHTNAMRDNVMLRAILDRCAAEGKNLRETEIAIVSELADGLSTAWANGALHLIEVRAAAEESRTDWYGAWAKIESIALRRMKQKLAWVQQQVAAKGAKIGPEADRQFEEFGKI